MKKVLAFFGAALLLCLSTSSINAKVVINEFSVSPPDNSDWVEIYSPEVVDISNWKVADETGEFHLVPEGTLLGPGIYYTLVKYQRLNNDKDTVFLYDNNGDLKDSIKYGYSGEVCLPSTEGSIARIPDGGNIYDRLSVGTKGQTNGSVITNPCPTPTPSPTAAAENSTPTPNATPTPTPTPTRSPTPPPTKKPTPRPTPTPEETNLAETVSESGSVLGAGSETPPPETPVSESGNSSRSPVLAIIFITLGVLLMGTAGYSIWVKSKTPPVQNAV